MSWVGGVDLEWTTPGNWSTGGLPTGNADVTCDGTITSTSIDVTCGGSITEAGCTITISSTVNATRSGDTLTGTGGYSLTFTGTCGPFAEDECFDEVYSGTRIAPSSTR